MKSKLQNALPALSFLILCFNIFLVMILVAQTRYYHEELRGQQLVRVLCVSPEEELENLKSQPLQLF